MAGLIRREGHQAWTAYEARLEAAGDDDLIVYAGSRNATLVTTNKDCVALARRLRASRVVYLRVIEVNAEEAMTRALKWLAEAELPDGMVLLVPLRAEIKILPPSAW